MVWLGVKCRKRITMLIMYTIMKDNTGKTSDKKPTTKILNYKKRSTDLLELSSPTTSPQVISYQEGL